MTTADDFDFIKPPFKIDVVYTWAGVNRTSSPRLAYCEELKYSIRSVIKFMPWVHRIFILMNPPKKIPDWFNSKYRNMITVVDHRSTFPDDSYLPCSNSNSIETTIQAIHNLSERFIYFNDDFFVGKPQQYTSFFTAAGKAVVSARDISKMVKKTKDQESCLGFKLPSYLPNGFYLHIPRPIIKSCVEEFQSKFPQYIEWIRSYQKRFKNGCFVCLKCNLACPCHQHDTLIARFMYKSKKAVLKSYVKNIDYIYMSDVHVHLKKTLKGILENPPSFFCINDNSGFQPWTSEQRRKRNRTVKKFFKVMYREVPFFEKITL
jgi:hypothetical protein